MARKTAQIYTVRSAGQFIGTFYALTPQQAIDHHKQSVAAYASVFRSAFRRGAPPLTYTAAVETADHLS